MITAETRAHLMAARDDIYRVGNSHPNIDLALVAAHIDRALRALCPHLPETWQTRTNDIGRSLTTCYACGMAWYNHESDPPHVPYAHIREGEAYLATLTKRLPARALAHGYAYVTPGEGERLTAHGLHQPGHSVHRFSTMAEDRSDAVLEERERLDEIESERAAAQSAVPRASNPRNPAAPQTWKV